MHFEEAVRHLRDSLNVPSLSPDASGAIAVALGEVVVNLRPAEEGECFTLDSRLGTLQSASPDMRVEMMAENRWPMASTTGVLGIDGQGFAFLFLRVKASQLPGARLEALLQRFARRATVWRQRIQAAGAGPALEAHTPEQLAGVLA